MKRSLLEVPVALTLALGSSSAASAATAEPPASCAGVVGASLAGEPGARAVIAHGFVSEAQNEGVHTPGELQSEWSRQREPLEGCLEFITP